MIKLCNANFKRKTHKYRAIKSGASNLCYNHVEEALIKLSDKFVRFSCTISSITKYLVVL